MRRAAMNEILAQWNHAAERYAAEQESSVNAELNKAEGNPGGSEV